MKHISKSLLVFALIFLGVNTAMAQKSLRDDQATKAKEVGNQVNSKDFVFEATHMDMKKGNEPVKYHKYDVAIAKDTLVANLPGVAGGPLRLSSANFSYDVTKGAKGDWDITIRPKAGLTANVKQLKMVVTPQGHASLRVVTSRSGQLALGGYIKQEDY